MLNRLIRFYSGPLKVTERSSKDGITTYNDVEVKQCGFALLWPVRRRLYDINMDIYRLGYKAWGVFWHHQPGQQFVIRVGVPGQFWLF
jgi:hypothetical protein